MFTKVKSPKLNNLFLGPLLHILKISQKSVYNIKHLMEQYSSFKHCTKSNLIVV